MISFIWRKLRSRPYILLFFYSRGCLLANSGWSVKPLLSVKSYVDCIRFWEQSRDDFAYLQGVTLQVTAFPQVVTEYVITCGQSGEGMRAIRWRSEKVVETFTMEISVEVHEKAIGWWRSRRKMQTFTITSKEVAFLLLVYLFLFQMIYSWRTVPSNLACGQPGKDPSGGQSSRQSQFSGPVPSRDRQTLIPASLFLRLWDVLFMEVLLGVYSEFRE